MDPAERIKAALARPEATKQVVTASPVLEPKAEVESTLPLLGKSDEARAAISPEGLRGNASSKPELEQIIKNDTVVKKERDLETVQKKPSHSRRIYIAFAACALVTVCALLLRQNMSTAAKPAPPPPTLQVEVRPEGKGLLNIHWNAQAAPIVSAREGRLVVLEANQQPRIIPLQADELKIGHVYYQSTVERQEFRLEVVNESGAVVRESVLAFSPGVAGETTAPPASTQPSPAPAPVTPPQTPAPAPANNLRAAAVSPVQTAAPPPVETPKPVAPAPKQFTPPPMSRPQQPREETREAVLDPTPLPTGIAAPARVNLPTLSAEAPPSRSGGVRPNSITQATVVNNTVEPAVLLKKVAPVYPVIAKTARIEGNVTFSATIDKLGHVQNLRVLSGPQMLIQAASDAVKKWQYRPMMLNGKPSEVITQLEVKFSLGR